MTERTRVRLALLVAALRPVLISACLVTVYYLVPMDQGITTVTGVELIGALLGVGVLIGFQTYVISRSRFPRLRAVEALATSLPLFLLLFSTAYYLMARGLPGSFTEPLTRTDALYFTLTVFSTVGFGDITPRTETARVATMVQMTGDLILVGVAARAVVAAVREGLRRRTGE
jgi:hypothetical protein